MSKLAVQYIVNNKVSTIWDRLKTSKVFWLCILFMLYQIQQWHTKFGTPDAISFHQLVDLLWYGLLGIMIRAAVAKSELASNALNPDITHIEAVPKPASIVPAGTVPAFAIMAVGLGLILSGCNGTSGEFCYTDSNGNKVCMPMSQPPPPAPTPTPPPIMPALEK